MQSPAHTLVNTTPSKLIQTSNSPRMSSNSKPMPSSNLNPNINTPNTNVSTSSILDSQQYGHESQFME